MEIIVFNSLKHHLHTIFRIITYYAGQNESSLGILKDDLVKIYGLIDIYEGNKSVDEIKAEIMAFLSQNNLLDFDRYKEFLITDGKLRQRGYYTKITLSDSTIMILRCGNDPARFVHSHPGRYSPNTFRSRANTLKTAILTRIMALARSRSIYDLDLVNKARDQLGLSPIPNITSAIVKILNKLE